MKSFTGIFFCLVISTVYPRICNSIDNCLICSNTQICDQCQVDHIWNQPICQECKIGEFSSNNECKQCAPQCQICNSSQAADCIKCNPGYELGIVTSLTVYHFYEASCVPCKVRNCFKYHVMFPQYLKISCPNTINCIHCFPGFILTDQGQCEQCQIENCELCFDGINTCNSCKLGYIYDEGNNLCNTPQGINGCSQSCNIFKQTKYYFQINVGQFCLENSQCLECSTGYYRDINTDKINILERSCLRCSENCLNCRFTANHCTSCPGLQKLQNNACVEDCQQGYYLSQQNTCRPCLYPCQTCESDSQCISCVNDLIYQVTDFQCVRKCPQGQFEHFSNLLSEIEQQIEEAESDDEKMLLIKEFLFEQKANHLLISADNVQFECRECSTNCSDCAFIPEFCLLCSENSQKFSLYNYECVEDCQFGYYEQIDLIRGQNKCIKCQAPCISCTIEECFACADPFELVENNCQYNQISAVHQGECENGLIQLENLCVFNCPDGMIYYEEENHCGCHSSCKHCIWNLFHHQTTCIECQDPTHMIQGPLCDINCPPGYFVLNDFISGTIYEGQNENLVNYCVETCPLDKPIIQFDIETFQFHCLETCPDNFIINNQVCLENLCSDSGLIFSYKKAQQLLNISQVSSFKDAPQKYYQMVETVHSQICQECPDDCVVCDEFQHCQECNSGFVLKANVCSNSCGEGYKIQNLQCSVCFHDCDSCLPFLKKYQNSCIQGKCPDHTRYDEQQNECIKLESRIEQRIIGETSSLGYISKSNDIKFEIIYYSSKLQDESVEVNLETFQIQEDTQEPHIINNYLIRNNTNYLKPFKFVANLNLTRIHGGKLLFFNSIINTPSNQTQTSYSMRVFPDIPFFGDWSLNLNEWVMPYIEPPFFEDTNISSDYYDPEAIQPYEVLLKTYNNTLEIGRYTIYPRGYGETIQTQGQNTVIQIEPLHIQNETYSVIVYNKWQKFQMTKILSFTENLLSLNDINTQNLLTQINQLPSQFEEISQEQMIPIKIECLKIFQWQRYETINEEIDPLYIQNKFGYSKYICLNQKIGKNCDFDVLQVWQAADLLLFKLKQLLLADQLQKTMIQEFLETIGYLLPIKGLVEHRLLPRIIEILQLYTDKIEPEAWKHFALVSILSSIDNESFIIIHQQLIDIESQEIETDNNQKLDHFELQLTHYKLVKKISCQVVKTFTNLFIEKDFKFQLRTFQIYSTQIQTLVEFLQISSSFGGGTIIFENNNKLIYIYSDILNQEKIQYPLTFIQFQYENLWNDSRDMLTQNGMVISNHMFDNNNYEIHPMEEEEEHQEEEGAEWDQFYQTDGYGTQLDYAISHKLHQSIYQIYGGDFKDQKQLLFSDTQSKYDEKEIINPSQVKYKVQMIFGPEHCSKLRKQFVNFPYERTLYSLYCKFYFFGPIIVHSKFKNILVPQYDFSYNQTQQNIGIGIFVLSISLFLITHIIVSIINKKIRKQKEIQAAKEISQQKKETEQDLQKGKNQIQINKFQYHSLNFFQGNKCQDHLNIILNFTQLSTYQLIITIGLMIHVESLEDTYQRMDNGGQAALLIMAFIMPSILTFIIGNLIYFTIKCCENLVESRQIWVSIFFTMIFCAFEILTIIFLFYEYNLMNDISPDGESQVEMLQAEAIWMLIGGSFAFIIIIGTLESILVCFVNLSIIKNLRKLALMNY